MTSKQNIEQKLIMEIKEKKNPHRKNNTTPNIDWPKVVQYVHACIEQLCTGSTCKLIP